MGDRTVAELRSVFRRDQLAGAYSTLINGRGWRSVAAAAHAAGLGKPGVGSVSRWLGTCVQLGHKFGGIEIPAFPLPSLRVCLDPVTPWLGKVVQVGHAFGVKILCGVQS